MVAALAITFVAALIADRILSGLEFTQKTMGRLKDELMAFRLFVPVTAALVACGKMTAEARTQVVGYAVFAYTILLAVAVIHAFNGE